MDQKRTLGDGMDSSLFFPSSNVSDPIKILEVNYKAARSILLSSRPVKPKLPISILIPRYKPKERKSRNYCIEKQREPKFVPYEPYKCAIHPIVPRKQKEKKDNIVCKPSKNNVDINNLVEQMSDLRTTVLQEEKTESINDDAVISKKQWETEKGMLETDIKNLRESNCHLENQLKFQAQVNSELKTLLVAAVGEDLESRVQHLTEDKLQLARALLNSANHLTSHQEQVEWLSGQCEVWKSKFLASSLMVEELARWKSALTNRANELQDVVKCLLEEHNRVYTASAKTWQNLNKIAQHTCNSSTKVPNLGNLIEISENSCALSSRIKQHFNIADNLSDLNPPVAKLMPNELRAEQLLRNPVSLLSKPDAICNAVMGAAFNLGNGQMFLQHPSSCATCCAHCQGEMQEV